MNSFEGALIRRADVRLHDDHVARAARGQSGSKCREPRRGHRLETGACVQPARRSYSPPCQTLIASTGATSITKLSVRLSRNVPRVRSPKARARRTVAHTGRRGARQKPNTIPPIAGTEEGGG